MKREDILGVRLSQPERELIEQQAKNDGRTASALVRHIVLTQLQNSEHTAANAKAPASVAGVRV